MTKETTRINKLIQKYNDLNGKIVSRKKLNNFHNELFDHLPLEVTVIRRIWKKIGDLLEKYPDTQEFEINIKVKFELLEVAGKKSTSKNISLDQVDKLGLPYFKRPIPDKSLGMNKSVSSDDIYSMVTNKIIDIIKTSGKEFKYKKSWSNAYIQDYEVAYNFLSKKPYTSINQLLLSSLGL